MRPYSGRMLARLALCAVLALSRAEDDFASSDDSGSTPIAEDLRDGLRKQVLDELETRGESISIMVVGETGLGKTSLLSSLFQTDLVWPEVDSVPARRPLPTASIKEINVPFDLDGVPFNARLIDSPGYGEGTDLKRSYALVTRYLHGRLHAAMEQEARVDRVATGTPTAWEEQPVDVILYFFAPHRCKGADLELLSRLKGKVSIVPILAKADTMTTDELVDFRERVSEAVEAAGVACAHPPVAVICAARPGGGEPRGREYPWGVALSEGGSRFGSARSHSELGELRQFLLIDGLLQLKATTREHYEAFRSRAIRRSRRSLPSLLSKLLPALLAALALPQTRAWAAKQLPPAAASALGRPSLPRLGLGKPSRPPPDVPASDAAPVPPPALPESSPESTPPLPSSLGAADEVPPPPPRRGLSFFLAR